jgi:hypothetical protein
MLKKILSLLLISIAILSTTVSCHERVTAKKKCKQDNKKVNKLKGGGNIAPGFK